MVTPEEERKDMGHVVLVTLLLIAFIVLLIFVGMMDQLLFDGELFGRK
jgi:hypothetical protein